MKLIDIMEEINIQVERPQQIQMPIDESIETDRPGKVFVGGLAHDIQEKDIEKYFGQFGRTTEVLIKRDRNTQQSRGYGFVTFENPVDAEEAVKRLDKKIFGGKEIHVEQAIKPKYLSSDDMRPPFRGNRGGRGGRGGMKGGFMERRGISSRGRGRGGGSFGARSRSPLKDRMPMRMDKRGSSRPSIGQRRGPSTYDAPPRRDGDRYGGMDRGMDRLDRSMDRGPPPRQRDSFSPPRDYRGLQSDSRMSSRGAARDYMPSSRFDPPPRDYSPPPSREYTNSRDYSYDRAPASRDRAPSREYGVPTREYNGGATSRSSYGSTIRDSYGGSGRDSLTLSSRDDYSSGRDFSREAPSRDYTTSRKDFGFGETRDMFGKEDRSYVVSGDFGSRSMPSRSEYDRGPPSRDFDSFRDEGRPSAPSRSFSSMGSGRDSALGRSASSRGLYDSPTRGPPPTSPRGPTSSSRGPPPSSSRGPPPPRGPPRGMPQSRTPPSRGPPSGSRGPPPREDRGRDSGYSAGQRRPPPSDSRGPPMKRPRPGGPPRGGGPPFRR